MTTRVGAVGVEETAGTGGLLRSGGRLEAFPMPLGSERTLGLAGPNGTPLIGELPAPGKLARIAWSILRNEKTFDLNLSAQHRTPEFSDQEPLKANGVRDPVKAPQREPVPRRDP